MNSKFIKRNNLSEQLCDIIKESITNGTYVNGDKLPSEMQLTKIYNVSRLTVRAALQRLNALGIVITKAGDGTYVNEYNIEDFLKGVSILNVNSKTLEDVKDFRRVVDLDCIRLAILNATDDELLQLKFACVDFESKFIDYKEDLDDSKLRILSDCDFHIHMKISELSKNSLYILAYKATQEIMKEFLYTIIATRYRRSKELNSPNFFIASMKGHSALYETIKLRDFEKSKKIYLNHIDYKVLSLVPKEFD
ncbi:MAG: FadR family transcriptional regulator [Bacillota bacterium]|jgi:GntR family transcriptional repressor for pyruvate dehydrogenase complex|nr:FadR family transcriptional regulator [Bacillota bacterium]